MKTFRFDRGFWFAISFLLLNAFGWWWVKQHTPLRMASAGLSAFHLHPHPRQCRS